MTKNETLITQLATNPNRNKIPTLLKNAVEKLSKLENVQTPPQITDETADLSIEKGNNSYFLTIEIITFVNTHENIIDLAVSGRQNYTTKEKQQILEHAETAMRNTFPITNKIK